MEELSNKSEGLDRILCDSCGFDITNYVKSNNYEIYHLCKDCMSYTLYIFGENV